jgi:hypothetical protein
MTLVTPRLSTGPISKYPALGVMAVTGKLVTVAVVAVKFPIVAVVDPRVLMVAAVDRTFDALTLVMLPMVAPTVVAATVVMLPVVEVSVAMVAAGASTPTNALTVSAFTTVPLHMGVVRLVEAVITGAVKFPVDPSVPTVVRFPPTVTFPEVTTLSTHKSKVLLCSPPVLITSKNTDMT